MLINAHDEGRFAIISRWCSTSCVFFLNLCRYFSYSYNVVLIPRTFITQVI